jgi:hypothetical protein
LCWLKKIALFEAQNGSKKLKKFELTNPCLKKAEIRCCFRLSND